MTTHQTYATDDPPGGAAAAVTIGFVDVNGKWNPISPSNPLPGSSSGGGSQNIPLGTNVSVAGAQGAQTWGGGDLTFNVGGTFGAATAATLQALDVSGNWTALSDATTLSAPGWGKVLGLPAGTQIRLFITGTPTSISAVAKS